MAIPSLWVLDNLNDQWVTWGPLVDGLTADSENPTYLEDCTVTATLYIGRNPKRYKEQPGEAVVGLNELALPYTGSQGTYRGHVEETFDPEIRKGYTMVIDASTESGAVAHWEIPAEIRVRVD